MVSDGRAFPPRMVEWMGVPHGVAGMALGGSRAPLSRHAATPSAQGGALPKGPVRYPTGPQTLPKARPRPPGASRPKRCTQRRMPSAVPLPRSHARDGKRPTDRPAALPNGPGRQRGAEQAPSAAPSAASGAASDLGRRDDHGSANPGAKRPPQLVAGSWEACWALGHRKRGFGVRKRGHPWYRAVPQGARSARPYAPSSCRLLPLIGPGFRAKRSAHPTCHPLAGA